MLRRIPPKKKKAKPKAAQACNDVSSRFLDTSPNSFQPRYADDSDARCRRKRGNLTRSDSISRPRSAPLANIISSKRRDSSANGLKQVRFDHTAFSHKESAFPGCRSPPPRKLKTPPKKARSGSARKKKNSCKIEDFQQNYSPHDDSACERESSFQSVYPFFGSFSRFSSGSNDYPLASSRALTPAYSPTNLKLSDLKLKYSEYKLPAGLMQASKATNLKTFEKPYISSNASQYTTEYTKKFLELRDRLSSTASHYVSPYSNITANRCQGVSDRTPNFTLSFSNLPRSTYPDATPVSSSNPHLPSQSRVTPYLTPSESYSSKLSSGMTRTYKANTQESCSSLISQIAPMEYHRPFSADPYRTPRSYVDEKYIPQMKYKPKGQDPTIKICGSNSDAASMSKEAVSSRSGLTCDYREKVNKECLFNTNFNKNLLAGAFSTTSTSKPSVIKYSLCSPGDSCQPTVSAPWRELLQHGQNFAAPIIKQGETEPMSAYSSRFNTMTSTATASCKVGATSSVGRSTNYREFLNDQSISPTKKDELDFDQAFGFLKDIKPILKSEAESFSFGVSKKSEANPEKAKDNDLSGSRFLSSYNQSSFKPFDLASSSSKIDTGMGSRSLTGGTSLTCESTKMEQQYTGFDSFIKDEGACLEKLNTILTETTLTIPTDGVNKIAAVTTPEAKDTQSCGGKCQESLTTSMFDKLKNLVTK